jgi:Matrixin
MTITGTLYAASANVGLSGNAQVTGALVVSTLTVSGGAGAFQLADGAGSTYTASSCNWITNGILTVAAEDDTGAGLDANELGRLGDAMAYLNSALASFGVNLSWAPAGAPADVTVHFATTTPQGGVADGVIGFTTQANDIYIVTGWNFYTGQDASAIAATQYDFLTLATHELAHTVGLGESSDASSVMYEYLAQGAVRRTFTDANLALINTNSDRYMKVGPSGGMALEAPAPVFLPQTPDNTPSLTSDEIAASAAAPPHPNSSRVLDVLFRLAADTEFGQAHAIDHPTHRVQAVQALDSVFAQDGDLL